MYYIKIFLFYSLFGFIFESTVFKITNTNKYSGIFYGPMTAVYGFGIIAIELLNKYLFKKIKTNKIIKYLLEYLILTIILSLIECLIGHTIHLIFKIEMWNYTNELYHFGKYLCLKNSLIWGLLGTLYINIIKKFTDKLLNQITKKETLLFLIIFIIDTISVLITKLP